MRRHTEIATALPLPLANRIGWIMKRSSLKECPEGPGRIENEPSSRDAIQRGPGMKKRQNKSYVEFARRCLLRRGQLPCRPVRLCRVIPNRPKWGNLTSRYS